MNEEYTEGVYIGVPIGISLALETIFHPNVSDYVVDIERPYNDTPEILVISNLLVAMNLFQALNRDLKRDMLENRDVIYMSELFKRAIHGIKQACNPFCKVSFYTPTYETEGNVKTVRHKVLMFMYDVITYKANRYPATIERGRLTYVMTSIPHDIITCDFPILNAHTGELLHDRNTMGNKLNLPISMKQMKVALNKYTLYMFGDRYGIMRTKPIKERRLYASYSGGIPDKIRIDATFMKLHPIIRFK